MEDKVTETLGKAGGQSELSTPPTTAPPARQSAINDRLDGRKA